MGSEKRGGVCGNRETASEKVGQRVYIDGKKKVDGEEDWERVGWGGEEGRHYGNSDVSEDWRFFAWRFSAREG